MEDHELMSRDSFKSNFSNRSKVSKVNVTERSCLYLVLRGIINIKSLPICVPLLRIYQLKLSLIKSKLGFLSLWLLLLHAVFLRNNTSQTI